MRKLRINVAVALIGSIVFTTNALAQKSKDTLRIAFADPISVIDLAYDPKPEIALTARIVYDGLVHYDDFTGKFYPLLAKSWKRIDAKTMDFDLRDDVKFHDGSEFDADDVVYTINWLINPKTRIRFKTNYIWINKVEKINKYKVRIHTKRPVAVGLMRLAKSILIYPSDTHGKLKAKNTFGKKPIGTGPLKVTQVDPNKGIILVRNDDYNHGGTWKPKPKIKTIIAKSIPDVQTRIAQLLTGGTDLIRSVPKDQVDHLKKNPALAATATGGLLYTYLSMDSVNRSGNKALSDQRVRKAISMGFDRLAVARAVLAGGDKVKTLDSMCLRVQKGCDFSTKPPAFNRVAAKKLLAEAGYPKGFEVSITALGSAGPVAVAVAGELRKIGIRGKVKPVSFGVYRKLQRQGKFEILVSLWSSGGLPDASSTLNVFFAKGRKGKWSPRNYWHDEIINKARIEGGAILDPEKRKAVYKVGYDRVNQMNYILPISTLPTSFVHSKDLVIEDGSLSPYGATLNHIHWK